MALDIQTESISSQLLGTQAQYGNSVQSGAPLKVNTESSELINTDVLTLTRLIKSRAESAAMRISASQKMEEMSAAQVATSAIKDIQNIMVRLNELSDRASNVQTDTELSSIQVEAQRLGQQIYNILNTQNYTGINNNQDYTNNFSQQYERTQTTPGSMEDLLNSIKEIIDTPVSSIDLSSPEKAAVTASNLTEAVEILDNYSNELEEKMFYLAQNTEELGFNMLSNLGKNASVTQNQAVETSSKTYEKIMQNPELASMVHSQLTPSIVANLLK